MDWRADGPARRPPAEVLRAPPVRRDGASPGLPHAPLDGRRPRGAAGDEVTPPARSAHSGEAPPGLATRMLGWRLAPEWRDFVMGDLEEEFHARAIVSRAAARRWYWRQAVRCVAAPPPRQALVQSGDPADIFHRSPRGPFMRTLASDLR